MGRVAFATRPLIWLPIGASLFDICFAFDMPCGASRNLSCWRLLFDFVGGTMVLGKERDAMRKIVTMILAVTCALGMVGCRFNKPTFGDFAGYRDTFVVLRDFILDCEDKPSVVNLNEEILAISGNEVQDEAALLEAVARLKDKGFSYVYVAEDYMIFWEDETGYYGVLWSENPKAAISRIVKDDHPYMKSRKLEKEWYEVGALDSI